MEVKKMDKNIEIEKIMKRMKEDTFFFSHYSDIGTCYQFGFLMDDVWKKDNLFCSFAQRLVKLIACDLKIPPERIGYGKWGARLIIEEDMSNKKIATWIYEIENHPSFKAFIDTCKIATEGKRKEDESELIYYTSELNQIFDGLWACYCFNRDYDKKEKYISEFLKDHNIDKKHKLFEKIGKFLDDYSIDINKLNQKKKNK